nr:hypothetical protein [Tanacetum cinerariifolium]
EAIQADCDVKATNIILQELPLEIYALVSTHKVAKDLWEWIQMLMQGTSLTKQERECKLYDAFDKFAYQKGETLCIPPQTTSSEHLPTLVSKQQSMMEGLLSNQFKGGIIICQLVHQDRLHQEHEEHLEGKG